ncbi:MAG TPA: hypothetical protein VMW54_05755 [Terriglobia bacterium]|nr:hypothetical protein [Terriglobia bacterium]
MIKQAARQFLISEEAPVIQNALYTLLAGVESRRDAAPGTRQRLEQVAAKGCNKLVLDLRAVEEPLTGMSPKVKSVRFDSSGNVVFIACEVPARQFVQQTEELCRPHFLLKHWAFSLGAFAYAFIALF